MVDYIYEISLQSMKAMQFNGTFTQTFWSLLVGDILYSNTPRLYM